jgi:hypothetical protein
MHRSNVTLWVILIGCLAVASACARRGPSRAHTATYTAGNEQELNAGAHRLEQLKEELKQRGFQVTSTTHSNEKDAFGLTGKYGELQEIQVSISIGRQMAMNKPHLAVGLSAVLPNEKAERDFAELDSHLTSTLSGK